MDATCARLFWAVVQLSLDRMIGPAGFLDLGSDRDWDSRHRNEAGTCHSVSNNAYALYTGITKRIKRKQEQVITVVDTTLHREV